MGHWRDILIQPETTVLNAMKVIDQTAWQAVIVVNSDDKLVGVVTDGDIRRGILSGQSLESPVSRIMNKDPIFATKDQSREDILFLMKKRLLNHVPVLDETRKLLRVEFFKEYLQPKPQGNSVVLMAGGAGERLRPLTEHCPKPLLKIGGKPILETIIERFVENGFSEFHLTVNYKADMLMEYFGNGDRYGAAIHYIRETRPMGTAGSLSQLKPSALKKPLIVMNADLLTKANFGNLLDFHSTHKAAGTMCVREYDFEVPYGVVSIDDYLIKNIDEKPVHRFFVNAGMYVLEPDALSVIPKGEYFDMTMLFEKLIAADRRTAAFPVHEYWLDIGRMDDFEKASRDYRELF